MPAEAPQLPQNGQNGSPGAPAQRSTLSTRKKRRSRKLTREWMPRFLAHYARYGIVKMACEAAGIDRTTVYVARDRDEAFAEAWEMAREDAIEELERVALTRAIEGSDTLIIFLLKAMRPEKYRERVEARTLNLHEHRHTLRQEPEHPEPTAPAIVEIVDVLAEAGAFPLPPGREGARHEDS